MIKASLFYEWSVIQILGKDQKNAIQSQGKDNLDNLTTE